MSISWSPGPPPDAMKDGRYVLARAHGQFCLIYWGSDRWRRDGGGRVRPAAITHWSEANPPEGEE